METTSLHEGFAGYTAQSVRDADLFIRERIGARLGAVLARMKGCVEKCREHRSIKLCSEIGSVARKCESILSECVKGPSGVLLESLSSDLARSNTPVENEKIIALEDTIDHDIAYCERITGTMTCVQTDTHIIETLSGLDRALNGIRQGLHERAKLLNAAYILNPHRQ